MNELRKLTLLLVIVLALAGSVAFAQGKSACYTTWDDNYFYAAFQVDDPDIAGVNSKPFSNPWEDDSVEVFFETDNKHASGSSANAYSMCVSAAGGAAFSRGGDDGVAKPKRIYSFKYSSVVDGSLNNSEDLDLGYTIELAIPWAEMGVKTPQPGTMMSFNIVVRMRGDSKGFVSLSPGVKTEQDFQDASKWVDIVFTAPTFGAATLSLDKIVSSRYLTRVPLIDGQVKPKEYNKNTSFELTLPLVALEKAKNQFQRMLLTYYNYNYQGDPRKSAPYQGVRTEKGLPAVTDVPIKGLGPWFSYDRVQWHKDELTDIKRAGIDIILPFYLGDDKSCSLFASKGLDVMVEALRELKEAGKPYPLVAMYLDTGAFSSATGSDLKDELVKKSLYRMVAEFYARIPEEFRAQVQMADERSGRPSYVVQLRSARPFSDLDESFMSYVNEQFAKEFDANLVWLGDRDFKSKAPNFDGYCMYGAGLGFTYDDTARVRIAAVGSGYDDCAIPGSDVPIRSREGGDTYRSDWSKLLVKRPNWVVIDSWNQFGEGSEICGSREYGFTYVDATAMQALKFRGPREFDAKYLRHNMPSTVQPDTFCQVDMLVQNDGIRAWRAGEGYALGYKWYQDGRLVGEGVVKRPIQKDVLPGQASEITIGVAAVRDTGVKLLNGNYELRFEMLKMSENKWFSSLGDDGLSVPVTVGMSKETRARFVTVDGPVMMKTGAAYTYKIRVRNDTTSTWKAGAANVSCSMEKVVGRQEPVDVAMLPASTVLTKDVGPGQIADVTLSVRLQDTAGKPLPVWKQLSNWSYRLAFHVYDGVRTIAPSSTRVVDLFDADCGACIIASDIPDPVEAGKTYEAKLVVRNFGPEPWTPGDYGIGYHWYYLDGTEAIWDGMKTPLKAAIKPGELGSIVTAKLVAPPFDGRYILAWDIVEKGRWASTADITRGGDILTQEVTVEGGKLQLVDLSKVYNIVACSPDRNRESGNFDGKGLSFPAEFMPPDIGMGKPNDIYPSGYYCTLRGMGLDSDRKISFKYGPKSAGDKNAVTCAGQVVEVPKAKYAKLHILGAAIEPDQAVAFGLGDQSSIESAKVVMSSWKTEPQHGEEVALCTLQRHSPSGDERGVKCYLFHYTVAIDSTRQISSIVLPKNDKVRVLAITLEKP